MSKNDYREVAEAFADEIVTHSYLQDVELPGVGTLALITLDNDGDHKRPTTLGPNTLLELSAVLTRLKERADAGEIVGAAITGKPYFFVAGADLRAVGKIQNRDYALQIAQLGHEVYKMWRELGVPTFAFVNGLALGGGLELALHSQYRTVSTGAGALGLPEAFLGLVPGWGGVYLLPRLIGPDAAITVMVENALSNNRTLSGKAAYQLGIADALFEPADFLESSLDWAGQVLSSQVQLERPLDLESVVPDEQEWTQAAQRGRAIVEARTSNAAPAPGMLLDLFEAARERTLGESAEAECEALATLMQTNEFTNTVHAFLDLVQKRAKRPAGAPDASLALPVTKVGVVGAGLMASQLALLFAQRLQVPVVMTDLSQEKVDKGVAYAHGELDKLHAKGRLSEGALTRTKDLISGSVSKEPFADADFVIEAVFEELDAKKKVFAEIEQVVSPEAILATNTSSLSVAQMAADLEHPERVIGFHFFNPVAKMPLLEIARTEQTSESALATAFVVAKALRKTAVLVKDSAAFVVNRILGRLFGEVGSIFDTGTPAEVVDNSLKPMGLPMTPFTLLALVGLPVGQHVQESLNAAFGDRFYVSENQQKLIDAGIKGLWEKDGTIAPSTFEVMSFGDTELSSAEALAQVQDALADEIGRMLEEGVVASPEDIDLCMILGAGWPMFMGGITPYLDQTGVSERILGKKFTPDAEAA